MILRKKDDTVLLITNTFARACRFNELEFKIKKEFKL